MRADIIILAAGQGSRMKSSMPKVLHSIAGKPMLERVILSAMRTQEQVGQGKIHVVIGHEAERIKAALGNYKLNWVYQKNQQGTGHAVKQVLPSCKGADVVMVLYGDVPLIRSSSLEALSAASSGQRLALLTINIPNPSGYGRIIRDGFGSIQAIIEDKDALPEQLAINEVYTGIMAIPGNKISQWIHKLSNNNAQNEYYLTDIVAMASSERITVIHSQPQALIEVEGVNSRTQLIELERTIQYQKAYNLMLAGVTIMDPKRIDIRGDVMIEPDVTLDINIILEGTVTIASKVVIEAGCIIRNTTIGEGSIIKAHSVIDESIIGENCMVGPFARLRPGTKLHAASQVGNFVEIKKSTIGASSKVNHLTYLGDTEVGCDVNIGAGTITCNYDGVNKHKTTIADKAFIGSNTALVAPVSIGKKATIGAGSTITTDVDSKQLAIARCKQTNIDNWKGASEKT